MGDSNIEETRNYGNIDSQISKKNELSTHRWDEIHLGLVQIMISKVLKGISSKASFILTMVVNILLSVFDTTSDLIVVYLLYNSEEYGYAVVTLLIDYVPGWQLAIHNGLSRKWRQRHSKTQTIAVIVYLIISPFSLPFIMIHWLLRFESAADGDYNAKLVQLLNGALESPAQITFLLVFWGKNKLIAPWNNNIEFFDVVGNKINLGASPGIFSLCISCLVIVKGVLDLAGKLKSSQSLMFVTFISSSAFFRITSFAFMIMFFNYWSFSLFIAIYVINFIIIFRYDNEGRRGISVSTSSFTAIFTPFVAYEETHWMDVPSADNNRESRIRRHTKSRRNLTASLSLKTLPLILLADGILLLLLICNSEFRYNEDIELCKGMSIQIIWSILLPSGFAAMISSVCLYTDDQIPKVEVEATNSIRKIKKLCKRLGMFLSFVMLTVSIGFGLSTVLRSFKGIVQLARLDKFQSLCYNNSSSIYVISYILFIEQFRVRIVTGDERYSDGNLTFSINGFVAGSRYFDLGEKVTNECFLSLESISVQNPTINGWIGNISLTLGGENKDLICISGCTGSEFNGTLIVDGDSDERHLAPTWCNNGNNCTLIIAGRQRTD